MSRESVRGKEAVISIAVREFVVMTIITFLAVEREGVHYRSKTDSRTTEQGAIVVPVSAGVLDHIGFSKLLQ